MKLNTHYGEREGGRERDGACINMRERCLAFMLELSVLVLVVEGPPGGTCRGSRRQHSTAGCSDRKLGRKEEGLKSLELSAVSPLCRPPRPFSGFQNRHFAFNNNDITFIKCL